jgi:hypothetical protein
VLHRLRLVGLEMGRGRAVLAVSEMLNVAAGGFERRG